MRQLEQVEEHLQMLLDLRIEGEIMQQEYAAKRLELQDRQAAISRHLECADRDHGQVADLVIGAFELSQCLQVRLVTADYNSDTRFRALCSKPCV